MSHGAKMVAFLKVGQANKITGYFECEHSGCFEAVSEAFNVDGKVQFTCPQGHENKL